MVRGMCVCRARMPDTPLKGLAERIELVFPSHDRC